MDDMKFFRLIVFRLIAIIGIVGIVAITLQKVIETICKKTPHEERMELIEEKEALLELESTLKDKVERQEMTHWIDSMKVIRDKNLLK